MVRHGQTEWNVQHKFQGHQDSPLTELGIQQAKWLGESFKNERIDIIYTSSSFRAVRTAELIRQAREIEIRQSDALKEMNLGDWEGRTQAEVERSDLESFDHFWNDPEKFRVQSGETFNEVSERAIRQFNQILNDQRGKSILLVTHTIVVKLLMAMCENMPIKHIWKHHYIHPTSLCKVEFTNGLPEIILHGDISHFKNI
nr:histidine phosphatase family protein [Paenibacillus sp. 1_12]